jgi:hypothetical protein
MCTQIENHEYIKPNIMAGKTGWLKMENCRYLKSTNGKTTVDEELLYINLILTRLYLTSRLLTGTVTINFQFHCNAVF